VLGLLVVLETVLKEWELECWIALNTEFIDASEPHIELLVTTLHIHRWE